MSRTPTNGPHDHVHPHVPYGHPGLTRRTVLQGMEVVDAIAAQATGVKFGFADVPLEDITITLAVQSR